MNTQDIISLQKEELNKNIIVNLYDNCNFLKYTETKNKDNIIELQKYDYGIVDKNTYKTKFLLYVDFAKTILNNTNITNCVFAGGCVFNILANYQTNIMNNSDIDIFFFGDIKQQEASIKKFMNKAINSYCGKVYRLGETNVYEVILPFHRKIQLIPTKFNDKFDIIKDFDLDYVKVLIDLENNVYCTLSCLYAYKYWMTYAEETKYNKKLYRYKKTLEKGMRLITTVEKESIINHNYKCIKLNIVEDIAKIEIKQEIEYFSKVCDKTEDFDVTQLFFVDKTNKKSLFGPIKYLCENRDLYGLTIPMRVCYNIKNTTFKLYSELYGKEFFGRDKDSILIKLSDKDIEIIKQIQNMEKTDNKILVNDIYLLAKIKRETSIGMTMYNPKEYDLYDKKEDKDKFYSNDNILYRKRGVLCNINVSFRLWKPEYHNKEKLYISAIVNNIESIIDNAKSENNSYDSDVYDNLE